MKKKLFGTDGIRGLVNKEPFTKEYLIILADAIFTIVKKTKNKSILIGKDTRESSNSIEKILVKRLLEKDIKIYLAGMISTPAISFLTQKLSCDLGIVISASHNSYEFNGLKFFNEYGQKLSDVKESFIEKEYLNIKKKQKEKFLFLKTNYFIKKGKVQKVKKPNVIYKKNIFHNLKKNYLLSSLKVVIDCANGSTHKLVKEVFSDFKAKLIIINNKPNGKNINYKCGSLYPEHMIKVVRKKSADFGISLDGDGDRIICCNEKGNIIDGDKILACLAKHYLENDMLKGGGVVGTVMSNMGLEKFLNNLGIKLFRSKVGDKFVYDLLKKRKCNLGGEQSGHIIIRANYGNYNLSGDGIAVAIQLLSIIDELNTKSSSVFDLYKPYPQIQKNIKLKDSNYLENTELKKIIKLHNNKIYNDIRVLIRFSGTEPCIRLLIEGEKLNKIKYLSNKLKKEIQNII